MYTVNHVCSRGRWVFVLGEFCMSSRVLELGYLDQLEPPELVDLTGIQYI